MQQEGNRAHLASFHRWGRRGGRGRNPNSSLHCRAAPLWEEKRMGDRSWPGRRRGAADCGPRVLEAHKRPIKVVNVGTEPSETPQFVSPFLHPSSVAREHERAMAIAAESPREEKASSHSTEEEKRWLLSDFDIVRPLGQGQFGHVYLARETRYPKMDLPPLFLMGRQEVCHLIRKGGLRWIQHGTKQLVSSKTTGGKSTRTQNLDKDCSATKTTARRSNSIVALKVLFKSQLRQSHVQHQLRCEVEIQNHLSQTSCACMVIFMTRLVFT